MVINNTELIRTLLSFDNSNDFYFVQIIKRRKENPNMANGSSYIKEYYINSFEDYDNLTPLIVKYCNDENARAYIHLNKRNYEDIGLKVLARSLAYISSKDFKALPNAFNSVAGKYHSDINKKWLVDVDNDVIEGASFYNSNRDNMKNTDCDKMSKLCDFLVHLQAQTKNNPMMQFIPTKNGMHIITRPFNLQIYKKEFPDISIHKDANTILYCP